MAELQFPNIVGMFQQGQQYGQAQRANKLAGLAYSSQGADRQSALGQLAAVDPRLAVGLGNAFQQQEAAQAQAQQAAEVDHAKKINGAARFVLAAYQSGDPARLQGAYQSVRPYLAELGASQGKVPPEQFDPSMLPHLYQIVGDTGGMPENKPVILSNGAQLVDPSTGQVVANNELEQKDPEAIATLKMLQGNPQLMAMWDRTHPRPESGGGMPKPPAGYRWTPDGNLAPIAGGPADPARKGAGGTVITNPDGSTTVIPAGKANTQELNNAGFYQRMVEADKTLSELESGGYDPTNLRDNLTAGGTITNFATSDNGQKYHQAAMNWVRANLRKESGAAIGKDEAEQEYKNYFPVPGDSAAVIAQKARDRQVVEEAMRTASGPAIGRTAQPKAAPQPAQSGGWSIEPVQ